MAADSLFGGSDSGGGSTPVALSDDALSLLNHFLTDTIAGSTSSGSLGGSPYVIGQGTHGEDQGGILPGAAPISGTISDGVLQLTLNLPAGTGLVFKGVDGLTPDDWGSFLDSIVDSYHAPAAQSESLHAAVQQLVDAVKSQGVTDVVVRVFDVMHGSAGPGNGSLAAGSNDIVIDAGANAGSQLFAVNLLHADEPVVLKGVENAVVANAGTIEVEGNTSIHIVGDIAAQNIIGGGGNDTLVGGGGNDTLTGGLGSDVFGFSALGHVTLTDFDVAHDKVAFSSSGITDIHQLAALVTSVVEAPTGVTFNFGPDASITLVGVSASEITSDLIKFTF